MNAKHQFKYTYSDTDLEEFSPVEVTFDMPGDVTLTQMLWNFERYLQAAGFVFDGELEIVDHTFDVMDEVDGALYEIDKQEEFEKQWDKVGCGCIGDSIAPKEYQEQRLKEWNEGIAKLDKEEREIRERASKRADELKQMEKRWKKISGEKKASILADVLKASGCYTATDKQYEKESREALEKELKKNKWVHGICNPPSPDWKVTNKNK